MAGSRRLGAAEREARDRGVIADWEADMDRGGIIDRYGISAVTLWRILSSRGYRPRTHALGAETRARIEAEGRDLERTIAEIAEANNVTVETVRRVLRAARVPPRRPGRRGRQQVSGRR